MSLILNEYSDEDLEIIYKTGISNISEITLYRELKEKSKIALESISNSLKNGGSVIIFDLLNPYPQNLQIIEENLSSASLKKIRLHIRNIEFFESQANDSGLNLKRASPFYIDIDLPSDEKSIVTHTKKFDGFRYSFRGTLFQPWHHIVLQKT